MYSLKPWHSFKALWIIIFLFPTIMWGQASITGPGVVCEDETIQLTCQSCASPATPSGWSSSDQTVATINNSGVVTGLSAGTVTITYTDSGGNQITKTITVGATPYLLNNGVVVYYCQEANATRTIGFAPNPSSNTISWFDKNNNSIITQGGVRTIDLSQPLDDTSYVCQVSPLGCQGPKSAVIAIVVATPLAPIVQDLDYCKDDIALPLTAQFGSSNPYSDVARSFYWFDSSNQVISPNAPSTNTVGTQTFYVQQVDSVPIAQYCYGPKSTLTVTTHANPGLPTVPITSFTYCQDETPSQISATADPGHHLNWYSSNGTPLSGPPTPSTTTPTYPGTPITYRVTQQNDLALNCESNYVTITVTVYPKAPTPTPTSALPIEYCEGDQTTQLSATMGVVGTLLWYSEDGTLLGSNPLPSTSVSDIGTTNYKVVLDPIDQTKCLSDTLTIPVIVHPRPNVTTTPAISICDGASIILNGGCVGCNEPVSYAWTGGVQNGVSFTPQYSNQPIVYTVTGTDDNQCENTATATVTVLSLPNPPTINGGSTITLCQGSGDYTLSANSDGTSTLIWYGSNGTSVLSGPPTINTNTSGVGSFTYFVSQKNPNTTCESNKLQITVNVVLNPPAPATSNISVCKNSTAPGWGVTAINGTTLQWYASNGTTPLASAPTQNTNSVGSTTYYVSQKTTNCEGPKSSITFEVTALPPTPIPNPTSYSYCFEQTASSLSATSLSGNSLRWYDTNGSLYNGTGTTAPTPPTTTSTTLYYEVSQVDVNGCESPKASIPVIIQPEVPVPVANTANTYEYCVDDNTYQLNATMTSPNNVLVYYNSDGTKTAGNGSAPTPSSTTSGTIQYYVVQKSLVTGCESDPLNLTVQIHALPIITTTTNVSACAGEGVTLSGSGAGPGGSYSWTGGVIDGQPFVPAFSNNPITYIVTGEDVNGCQNTDTATITVNALPGTPTVLSNSYSYCKDANASPLIANASSGHSLIWYDTDGTTVLNAPFTPPTNYTGTNIYYVSQVSATTNCESPTVPITVVVGVGIPKPTTFDRSACFGDPSTQLSATKITGNSLKWFAPDGTTQLAFAPTYSTLTIGTTSYYVSQVNPSTGCESPKDTLDVTIYALPPVSAGTDQTVCDGESVTLLGSGAVSYSWSGIDYAGNTISNGVAFTPPSSTSTTYTITGTDANGCTNTDAVTVNTNAIPVPPTIDPNSQTTFITGSVSSVLSAISLPGFTLTWYNSDGTLVNGTGSAPTPSTAPANVGITEYLVTQTSASGCESAPLTVQIVVLGVNVSNDTTICLTDTAQLLVSTYSANNSTFNSTGYTFIGTYNGSDYYISPIDTSWSEVRNRALSDGGDLVNITDSAENYFVTQGLMPYSSTSFGPYYYMGIYQDLGSTSYAEPSGGWFTIDSNMVSYSNWKPGEPNNLLGTEHFAEIVIDSATQVEFWNDITDNQAKKYGVIEVPASNSPSWSYLWSTGDTTSTINVNPSVDTQYWVAISDGNNTWYDTVDVTVNLLDINITQTDTILCAGDSSGTLGVAINPGYGPYSYLWNTGDISDSLKNVSVGTYSVVVTDAMGCSADDAITIIQPNNMVVTTQSITNFNGYDVSCNGVNDAAAFASAAGGTPGYSYSWSNGGATDTLTSLAAGTYFVTVIDSNGCSSQDTLTITEPSALSLSVSTLTNVFGNQIDCYGDSSGVLFSAVAGGVGTYSYSWNTGASQDSIYNLGAGTYWVTAQDANGCTITDSITLTQPSLPFSTVASNLSNYNGFGISCNGANDGSISVLAQGSNAPYSYAWSNGATTASQSNLGQGTYSVVVTDSLGCVSNASVVITEPSILTYSYIISDVTCYLGQNGSIEIIPQGGVMPYNIQWFDGTDSTVLDSLGSGYYAFTISDQNNCLVLDSVEIYEPAEIEITVDTIQPTCERINDGQIDAFIYGGTYPYSYTLNGSPVNLPLDSVAVGSYILSVVDSNSCTQTIAFDLEPLQPSCFMIPNMYSPNYDGYNDEFRIRHSSWSSYTLTIYNSIGQLVYSGSSSTPYWDGITNGSPMPTGDYYYQLITNEGEVIYGYVTLIR
jgi:gliding motility-associated-like protein